MWSNQSSIEGSGEVAIKLEIRSVAREVRDVIGKRNRSKNCGQNGVLKMCLLCILVA